MSARPLSAFRDNSLSNLKPHHRKRMSIQLIDEELSTKLITPIFPMTTKPKFFETLSLKSLTKTQHIKGSFFKPKNSKLSKRKDPKPDEEKTRFIAQISKFQEAKGNFDALTNTKVNNQKSIEVIKKRIEIINREKEVYKSKIKEYEKLYESLNEILAKGLIEDFEKERIITKIASIREKPKIAGIDNAELWEVYTRTENLFKSM
ncbi:unnamed protein product [Blepharisma stoltei]|uniref:Uncharacterized protein n=1 Tax=Blepharisma stoltei TaxID=1481888 RepID=A0AAU9IMI0_9CILI|nr:unnamed protein product [Blepharisma stoltei]